MFWMYWQVNWYECWMVMGRGGVQIDDDDDDDADGVVDENNNNDDDDVVEVGVILLEVGDETEPWGIITDKGLMSLLLIL